LVFLIISFYVALFFIFRKLHLNILYKFHGDFDDLEENINLTNKINEEKKNILKTLPSKYERISSLFHISEKFSELIDPEEIFDFMIKTSGNSFPQADNILLFSLEKHKDSLSLIRSLKRKDHSIKEKKGDILDKWILRYNQCLMVEDLTKDFRFEYSKTVAYNERNIRSLISCPISIGEKILGTMRIESKVPSAFSLDDSRLLLSICDLGAVILERANLFKRAEELAIKDSLTSLFLKDYFFKRLEEEINRTSAKKTSFGIIMLDIDDFKKINDTHGHIVGDIVLKKLANMLKEIIGNAGNIICRFGGEEFILFIVECSRERLVELGESVRKKVEQTTVNFRRQSINFTVSLGAVLYPQDADTALKLIDAVDHLLYRAKREGKNRLCFTR
jgi:diguanylate cyclase (GGDEF)-like protein